MGDLEGVKLKFVVGLGVLPKKSFVTSTKTINKKQINKQTNTGNTNSKQDPNSTIYVDEGLLPKF